LLLVERWFLFIVCGLLDLHNFDEVTVQFARGTLGGEQLAKSRQKSDQEQNVAQLRNVVDGHARILNERNLGINLKKDTNSILVQFNKLIVGHSFI